MTEIILYASFSLFLIAMSYIIYNTYIEDFKLNSKYRNYLIGYKIGVLKKKAKENDVEICLNSSNFNEKIEKEIDEDLNKI